MILFEGKCDNLKININNSRVTTKNKNKNKKTRKSNNPKGEIKQNTKNSISPKSQKRRK